MSIATLSKRVHDAIPADELVGSLNKERVELLVRRAGFMSIEDGGDADQAGRWLAYAVEADLPYGLFTQLNAAYSSYADIEQCDLMNWFDIPNTEENRADLLRDAEVAIDGAVSALTVRFCQRLRITK